MPERIPPLLVEEGGVAGPQTLVRLVQALGRRLCDGADLVGRQRVPCVARMHVHPEVIQTDGQAVRVARVRAPKRHESVGPRAVRRSHGPPRVVRSPPRSGVRVLAVHVVLELVSGFVERDGNVSPRFPALDLEVPGHEVSGILVDHAILVPDRIVFDPEVPALALRFRPARVNCLEQEHAARCNVALYVPVPERERHSSPDKCWPHRHVPRVRIRRLRENLWPFEQSVVLASV
mmetsp:Transcript_2879/g.6650  ORF Transcript_2879/g.6650 Transcript_2879/m.6650 type:complete len:234 (+) Transcript_2879:3687-4388(+)